MKAADAERTPSAEMETNVERFSGLDGLVDAVNNIQNPRDERRMIFAKGENYRHIRHAQILARWPVLPEGWARRLDEIRVSSVDRTTGPASFGR